MSVLNLSLSPPILSIFVLLLVSCSLCKRNHRSNGVIIVNPNGVSNHMISHSKETEDGNTIIVVSSPPTPSLTSSGSFLTDFSKSIKHSQDPWSISGIDGHFATATKIRPSIICPQNMACHSQEANPLPKFIPVMVPYYKPKSLQHSILKASTMTGQESELNENRSPSRHLPQIIIRKSKDSPPIIIEEVKENGSKFVDYHFSNGYDSKPPSPPVAQLESPLVLEDGHTEAGGYVARLPLSMALSSISSVNASQSLHPIIQRPIFVAKHPQNTIQSPSIRSQMGNMALNGPRGGLNFPSPEDLDDGKILHEEVDTSSIPQIELSSLSGPNHLNDLLDQEEIHRLGMSSKSTGLYHRFDDRPFYSEDQLQKNVRPSFLQQLGHFNSLMSNPLGLTGENQKRDKSGLFTKWFFTPSETNSQKSHSKDKPKWWKLS